MFQCIVFVKLQIPKHHLLVFWLIQYDCKFWHSFVHRDNFEFLFELFWRILDTKSFHLISCTIISGITWSVNKHDGQRAHNTSCFGIDRRYVASKYFAWYYTSKWWKVQTKYYFCCVSFYKNFASTKIAPHIQTISFHANQ